jgi:hypothetical protein
MYSFCIGVVWCRRRGTLVPCTRLLGVLYIQNDLREWWWLRCHIDAGKRTLPSEEHNKQKSIIQFWWLRCCDVAILAEYIIYIYIYYMRKRAYIYEKKLEPRKGIQCKFGLEKTGGGKISKFWCVCVCVCVCVLCVCDYTRTIPLSMQVMKVWAWNAAIDVYMYEHTHVHIWRVYVFKHTSMLSCMYIVRVLYSSRSSPYFNSSPWPIVHLLVEIEH